ncbi:hypothetical protein [Cohnella endophytica]|uniref:hypothetical protein n=1 Tax=Cohnella endophytica TaxID=2419778 RepID=UPI001F1FE9A3|nr:hypothetical protein [Cohnella endophytica]
MRLWFQALYLHAAPHGISATRLASIIGTTYKTAWLICHKIRHAMSTSDSSTLLTGIVKVNWGVYGKPYNPTVYRHPQEQPLLAGVSVGSDGHMNYLKIKQVPDEHLVYDRIVPSGGHQFVQQHVDPSRENLSVVILKFSIHRHRDIIRLCKQAACWINDTFNGIGPKHLQSYLDQFCFDFIQKHRNNDRFEVLLTWCAITPTLKYPTLIRRKNDASQHKRSYLEQLKNAS